MFKILKKKIKKEYKHTPDKYGPLAGKTLFIIRFFISPECLQ
jgi:hypothetical protein